MQFEISFVNITNAKCIKCTCFIPFNFQAANEFSYVLYHINNLLFIHYWIFIIPLYIHFKSTCCTVSMDKLLRRMIVLLAASCNVVRRCYILMGIYGFLADYIILFCNWIFFFLLFIRRYSCFY